MSTLPIVKATIIKTRPGYPSYYCSQRRMISRKLSAAKAKFLENVSTLEETTKAVAAWSKVAYYIYTEHRCNAARCG